MNTKKGCFWDDAGTSNLAKDVIWLDAGAFTSPDPQAPGATIPVYKEYGFGAAYYGGVRSWSFDDTNGQICAHVGLNPNWNKGTLETRLYWYANGISHNIPNKWEIAMCLIGDQESLIFQPTWISDQDKDLANNQLCITDVKWINPDCQGASKDASDLLAIYIRRINDDASGLADFIGLKLDYFLI